MRLGREQLPVDARPPVRREHACNLIEREAGGAPEHDQREALQHGGPEYAPQAAPADRGDQALFLVEPQRRGRNAGALRHLGDIQAAHPLDLKLT